MSLRVGSLFAGYGGIDLGLATVLNTETVWFSEFDKAPSKILAHHWPDVPNLGDITQIDWSTVPPVDILTGGFPCQDVSLAGARAGFTETSRSGLWSEFARAIAALNPRLVVIENVRGLLSATASGSVEPDPWGMGDGSTRPVINALGAVLGDLANLGYDAEWCGVRAADAGAPHGRYRIFIVAHRVGERWGEGWPESAGREGRPSAELGGAHFADASHRSGDGQRPRAESREGDQASPHTSGARRGEGEDAGAGRSDASPRAWGLEPQRGGGERPDATDADPADNGHERGRGTRDRRTGLADRGEPAADTRSDESERRGGLGDLGSATTACEGHREERQRVRDTTGHSGPTAANSDGAGLALGEIEPDVEELPASERSYRDGSSWGDYTPAVRRWERVIQRPAPNATRSDGKGGAHRLSASFVEWMMGLLAGHVTDPAIGLTRNEQLKALGNGVVPQQCALALRYLLGRLPQ